MSSSADAASAQRPFGPSNPDTFYKAQKRNRRATWRLSALGVLAAIVMGIPLTLVITPLLYTLVMIAAEIINYVSPLPSEFWDNMNGVAQLALRVGDYYINNKGSIDQQELMTAIVLVLLPGMALTFFLWMSILALFRRAGVGGALASLSAREPDKADLKELQFCDAVDEMAIAAGIPAPKLMLIDTPGANAAALGTSPFDARIVISRRLLDDLNRTEMEGLLAHMVASIGNGDLHIAFTVTSVFETCGLLFTIINAPFGKTSRETLWRVLRYAFRRGPVTAESAAEADAVASLLTGSLSAGSEDVNQLLDSRNASFFKKIYTFVLYPLLFTNIGVEMTMLFFLNLMLGPCMALVWRTRRYLADATAVQLTRNADGLASALQELGRDDNSVAGGTWASHLFVIDPKGDRSGMGGRPSPERFQALAQAWENTRPEGSAPSTAQVNDYARLYQEFIAVRKAALTGDPQAAARMAAFTRAAVGMRIPLEYRRAMMAADARESQEVRKRGATGFQVQSVLSFHPSLKGRLKRLQKMGSHIAAPGWGMGTKIAMTVLYLLVGPLLLVAFGLGLVALAMLIMLNLMFLSLWLGIIHGIFTLLGHR